ncbi:MAG: hypothetical protein JNL24_02000 [Bacteroidia bacterium]|nr:hypothetical protein [Bacteroidia bacterium]
MENQRTQQEASANQARKENGGKDSPKASLCYGFIAFAFTAICLIMFSCASTSRPSTSEEIAAQMKFQEKWNATEKEAEQKWDSTLKAEQKPESIGK